MSLFKNKRFVATTILVFLFGVFFMPFITQARFIDCSLSTTTGIVGDNKVGGGCDFTDLIATINKIINWIISISVVIFAISAIWGGFLYITSGVNAGNKDKAKKILWSTLTGFVIILVAWLIVFTILNTFVKDSSGTNSIFKFIGGSRT